MNVFLQRNVIYREANRREDVYDIVKESVASIFGAKIFLNEQSVLNSVSSK